MPSTFQTFHGLPVNDHCVPPEFKSKEMEQRPLHRVDSFLEGEVLKRIAYVLSINNGRELNIQGSGNLRFIARNGNIGEENSISVGSGPLYIILHPDTANLPGCSQVDSMKFYNVGAFGCASLASEIIISNKLPPMPSFTPTPDKQIR